MVDLADMTNFEQFSLNKVILHNLAECGHLTPTLIQAKAIPVLMQGHDLLGIAQTGTGKTAAFALPVLELLTSRPKKLPPSTPRALVIVPTRELALQIEESFHHYGKDLPLQTCVLYGGVEQKKQIQILKAGIDIVVATPGRLLDLHEQKQIDLSEVEILVLDEADRMLDMGFIDDIHFILNLLPSQRQLVLFSATMNPHISSLASRILRNPKRVEVSAPASIVHTISQKLIYCKADHKFQLLKKLIKQEEIQRVLIFTKTKILADQVVEYLAQNRLAARAIHGDKTQNERERAIEHFKEGVIKILVATDLASRGIDILDISHVINFNLPLEAENYIHRIGRTGRAGKKGVSISFCDDLEMGLLDKIQQLIQYELVSEKFQGQSEKLKFKNNGPKKITPPTPGKSQEKSAYKDHSKRQRPVEEGDIKKRVHPGFKKVKKKR